VTGLHVGPPSVGGSGEPEAEDTVRKLMKFAWDGAAWETSASSVVDYYYTAGNVAAENGQIFILDNISEASDDAALDYTVETDKTQFDQKNYTIYKGAHERESVRGSVNGTSFTYTEYEYIGNTLDQSVTYKNIDERDILAITYYTDGRVNKTESYRDESVSSLTYSFYGNSDASAVRASGATESDPLYRTATYSIDKLTEPNSISDTEFRRALNVYDGSVGDEKTVKHNLL